MKRYTTIIIAVLVMAIPAWSTTFTKVADTSTAIPGGYGNFIEFSDADTPAIDDGKVVFRGQGLDASSEQTDGIYTTLYGGLDVVADTDTQIPGADPGETFDTSDVHGFGSPTISGSNIAFKGDGDDASLRGIYAKFGAKPAGSCHRHRPFCFLHFIGTGHQRRQHRLLGLLARQRTLYRCLGAHRRQRWIGAM